MLASEAVAVTLACAPLASAVVVYAPNDLATQPFHFCRVASCQPELALAVRYLFEMNGVPLENSGVGESFGGERVTGNETLGVLA